MNAPLPARMAMVAPLECLTCGCAPCAGPSFCAACARADRKIKPPSGHIQYLRRILDDVVSFDRAQAAILRRRQRP